MERALIAAQIHLEKGDVREGLNVISGLPDATKYRAGPLSAMVTLCLALNDRAAAADTLKKAVKHQQVLTSFKVRIKDQLGLCNDIFDIFVYTHYGF